MFVEQQATGGMGAEPAILEVLASWQAWLSHSHPEPHCS